jgi:hypothetical protein
MMVIAMHYIDKFLSPLTVRYCVKGKPVHQIFKECPEKTTGQKIEKYS